MKLTIDIDDLLHENFLKYYSSVEEGLQTSVKAWLAIRRNCYYELRGVFESNELKFLIELLKDDVDIQEHLAYTLYEFENCWIDVFEDLEQQYGIEIQMLREKVAGLSQGESAVLIDWIMQYRRLEKQKKVILDEYVAELSQKSRYQILLEQLGEDVAAGNKPQVEPEEIRDVLIEDMLRSFHE